jgi:hypothetical protein
MAANASEMAFIVARTVSRSGCKGARVLLPDIRERLGHADPDFTLSTYTHVVPGTQEAAAQAIREEGFPAARTNKV